MRRTLLAIMALLLLVSPVRAGDAKTTLTIQGMTCGGCVAAVKLQLKRTPGVVAYEVSLEKGQAEVTYDAAKTAPAKIAEAVSSTGYTVSVAGVEDSEKTPERLEAWEPVDPSFKGCSEGVCGMRGRNPQAVVQPGAQVGQLTYCPVSGAVFRIKETSRRVEVRGKTLYLCCEACARYFAKNQDHVLALRGWSL